MGFESGLVVLWDLRTKVADSRFIASEPLRSVSWLSDGKQLISAHTDGSLYTWNSRAGPRPAPVSIMYPHGRSSALSPFGATVTQWFDETLCVFVLFVQPKEVEKENPNAKPSRKSNGNHRPAGKIKKKEKPQERNFHIWMIRIFRFHTLKPYLRCPGTPLSFFRAVYHKTGPADRPASPWFTVAIPQFWKWNTTLSISSLCVTLPGPVVSF